VTDGASLKQKKQMGGYFPVDVDRIANAIGIAKRVPSVRDWHG
jgi:hypothetical protein